MVSHDPPKLGGPRYYGSGDLMFLVVEEQDFTCCRLNPPLLFQFVIVNPWEVSFF